MSKKDLAAIDRISDLSYQAIGILQMMRRVDTTDVLPTRAISGTAWAVERMVQEIQQLATAGYVGPFLKGKTGD